jgi:flagellum-specific ATP synthase
MTTDFLSRGSAARTGLGALIGSRAEGFASAGYAASPLVTGRVTAVIGLTVTVAGLPAAVGELLQIEGPAGPVAAEVVAVGDGTLACLPIGSLAGIQAGAPVVGSGQPLRVPVGESLRGRVLDGLGRPIDGLGPLLGTTLVGVENPPPNPLLRGRVDRPLSVGVRALDTLVPVGRGQRFGIFAGSGVGKSSLLSMIARGTDADLSVIALVGERGREVREFLENDLGPEGLARSVVIVATSDQPPLVRLRAAFVATRVAEYFRDGGLDVVLMMDSLTRTAMAQREVGLSAGEPPATRGYPPSTFAMLPRLLERAGPGERGSITGIYTVLVEGDDHNEPIADSARSILDGHVVLSRALATAGHFPTIDVLDSVSRVSGAVTTREQRAAATRLRSIMAAHREAKELIEIGAYVAGTNPQVDLAREIAPGIDAFLRQDLEEIMPAPQAWQQLFDLLPDSAAVATVGGA